jgi:hypothetical protein
MKAPIPFLAMLFSSLLLVAGSERAHASAYGPPPADNVKIDVSSSSVKTNSTATLTVTVTRRNGTPEADGTILSATVSPPTIGTVAGVGAAGTASGSTSPLVGGVASFVFIAGNTPGTATITISLPPVNNHPNTVTTTTQIAVSVPDSSDPGAGNNPSLVISPTTVTLPQNLAGVGPYLGSPYMAELKVEWRGLITGQLLNGKISASITPTVVAAFSTLDDPTTPWVGETKTPPTAEGNEFLTELGSGPITVTAGIGTIYVHAGSVTGTATLNVTALDPETNRTISSQMKINVITPPGANLPTSLTLSQSTGGVYINAPGTPGPQSKAIIATVGNIYGTPAIAAPGTDNIRFEIVGPAGTDALLSGFSPALGVQQVGTSITAATGSGGANVYFLAGKKSGPVQIQATVDAYDGDIGNGVTIPITATTSVMVSDGRLYNLTITTPVVNAIAVNGVSASTSTSGGSAPTIPLKPDATYSLTVSALATDRQGNPVPPGTEIRFGLIDGPQTTDVASSCGLADFQICGTLGNPQPGGTYFSSPDGHFHSKGGGAGPGDTLVVFGKQRHGAPAGYDDLETALSIAKVVDDTTLFTYFPFNLNDTSGSTPPSAPLPYVIGRATIGNINSPVTTDSNGRTSITGVATTTLNYPVSQLSKSVVIWAQGAGTDPLATNPANSTRTVTDAIVTGYPGLADVKIIVSPSPIPGNTTADVQVCIIDALRVPIPGVAFDYSFGSLGVGSGSVDGVDGASGHLTKPTDTNGCVDVSVTTNGLASSSGGGSGSSGGPTLTFSSGAGGATTTTNIVVSSGPILLAAPSALNSGVSTVTLTLLQSDGTPVPGVQLTGTCDAKISIQSPPAPTDAHGKTTVTISADLDAYKSPSSGKCTFTTSTGTPVATVNLQGIDLCLVDQTNPLCGFKYTLTISLLSGGGNAYGSISSAPGGLACAMGATTSGSPPVVTGVQPTSCSAEFLSGSAVAVAATVTSGSSVTWSGNCPPQVGSPLSTSVIMNSPQNCTVTFNP